MNNQPEPARAKPQWRNLAVLVVGGVACACLGCIAVGAYTASTPEFKATRTAEAIARVTAAEITHAVVIVLSQTATAAPTVPSETPVPTTLPTDTHEPTLTVPPPPSDTPAPTVDVALGLSLVEFTSKYDRLTDLQREDFLASLPGKTVDWTGKVSDVDRSGVNIEMPGDFWNGYAVLKDVPDDVALTITKGSRLHFTGTIENTIRFVFFYVYLVDVKIVK